MHTSNRIESAPDDVRDVPSPLRNDWDPGLSDHAAKRQNGSQRGSESGSLIEAGCRVIGICGRGGAHTRSLVHLQSALSYRPPTRSLFNRCSKSCALFKAQAVAFLTAGPHLESNPHSAITSRAYTQEHFDDVVLIEAVVEGLTEPIDMGKLGRMSLALPDDLSA